MATYQRYHEVKTMQEPEMSLISGDNLNNVNLEDSQRSLRRDLVYNTKLILDSDELPIEKEHIIMSSQEYELKEETNFIKKEEVDNSIDRFQIPLRIHHIDEQSENQSQSQFSTPSNEHLEIEREIEIHSSEDKLTSEDHSQIYPLDASSSSNNGSIFIHPHFNTISDSITDQLKFFKPQNYEISSGPDPLRKDKEIVYPQVSENFKPFYHQAALHFLNATGGEKKLVYPRTLQFSEGSLGSLHSIAPPEFALDNSSKHEGRHGCSVCNNSFKTAAQLKNHYWRHTGEKPFKCEVCQASFTQLANLKTHQRIHTGERPFICNVCGTKFTQVSNLKTHSKLHTGEKPYHCDFCDSKFTQQSNLKSHRLTHTGERPYLCNICNASFVQSTHLRNHKRIHTNERPYTCIQCGASFRQLSNLKTHEKTHSGEKPFACIECGTAFAQKSNLKSHRFKLHGVTEDEVYVGRGRKISANLPCYVCHECGLSFSTSVNLKVHMRLHIGDKPFSCQICSLSFSQKSNLKAHLMTHSDQRPFSCLYCSSSFKQKCNLRTHVVKKHPMFVVESSADAEAQIESDGNVEQTGVIETGLGTMPLPNETSDESKYVNSEMPPHPSMEPITCIKEAE